ncbi:MAG: PH domain-containing protein [Bacteroides sp.]|nr:PH domain-containing protein [Bacteroides sp.]
MDRIFHARTAWYQYLLLILLTVNTVYFLWIRSIGIAVVLVLLLVVLIEQIIHTTYTLTTEGRLNVHYGRFRREKEVTLSQIRRITPVRKLTVGRYSLVRYLLVEYKDGSPLSLIPRNEEEFLKCIYKQINT